MALTASQKTVLIDELTLDPLGRGYAAMSDAAVADDLNAPTRGGVKARMEATEVLNAVAPAEYKALTDSAKQQLWGLLGMGSLDPSGVEKDILVEMFGAGSATVANLQSARQTGVGRAAELGLPAVRHLDVAEARRD